MMKLTIPQPCSEDYIKMSATEKGRFCSSCKKEVIDFTSLSEYQILEVFRNNNSKVCGRFQRDQLEKEYKNTDKSSGTQSSWIAAMFATIMVLSSSKSKAEISNRILPDIYFDQGIQEVFNGRSSAQTDSVKLIKGKVVDEKGEGLPGASIQLKGTSIKAFSGIDGGFEIKIPGEIKPSEAELQINFIGYVTLLKSLKQYKEDEHLVMSLAPAFLGEVVVVRGVVSKKPTLWSRFIGLFK